MIKQTIIAALTATAAVAGVAFAQQAPAPGDTPATTQAQQRPEASDQDRDEGGRRWRREFRGDRAERGDRRSNDDRPDRRSDDRERMGPPGGMMRGPSMMMGFCGPNGGRFADAMLDRIERATRPTEQQKPAFDALKTATTKAAETAKTGCPTEPSLTPPGRLANAEKRLTAMLDAIRTVRPAMDAYYNSLSDEQKARLLMSRRAHMDRGMSPMGDRRDGWRGPERGEPRDNYRNPDREGSRERRFDRRPDRDEDRDQRGGYDRTGSESDSEQL
jgi:hypothetical protein